MGKAIEFKTGKEGEIFMKYLHSRLIRNNKNVLGAELGPTGSGKSYRDLRKAELWYEYHFKEKFPVENICFGVGHTMKLLSRGKLRRGEIIVFEEAGANLGSLDFQNKISKMMTYILQSFRSMNIAIFFNLPYLSMLNKQARMLMHYSFESAGIDFKNKLNKCKPKFHQVNQDTGKVYKKYPIIKDGSGSTKKVKRFGFAMPSKYLIEAYEQKKEEYLKEMTLDYSKDIEEIENKKRGVIKKQPTELAFKCYNMHTFLGKTQKECGESIDRNQVTVSRYLKEVREYMEMNNIKGISLKKEDINITKPLLSPQT